MADEIELENLTFNEIKKLKVAELKAKLSHLGLPVTGLKADLVARLASYLESKALQAALIAKNEEEFKTHTSSVLLEEPGIKKVTTIVLDLDDETNAKPDDDNVLHVPEPTSELAGDVVADVVANVENTESDIPINMDVDETRHVALSLVGGEGELAEQKHAMQVDEIVEKKDSGAVQGTMKPDEKEPEIVVDTQPEKEETEIEQEERETEIEEKKETDFESQTKEEEVEVEPHKTSTEQETDELASKEAEPEKQVMEYMDKPVEEDQFMVEHHKVQCENTEEIEKNIAAASSVDIESMPDQCRDNDKPQPTDADQSDLQVDVKINFPVVAEPESSIEEPVSDSTSEVVVQNWPKPEESSSSVDEMETESTEVTPPQSSVIEEPAVIVEVDESVEKKQQLEDVPLVEPVLPSHELPEITPALEPLSSSPSQVLPHPSLQTATQVPDSTVSQVPTHQVSNLPSLTTHHAPSLPPFEGLPQKPQDSHQQPDDPSGHKSQIPTQPQSHTFTPSTPPRQVLPEPVIETKHATPNETTIPQNDTPEIDAQTSEPLPEGEPLGGTHPSTPTPQSGTRKEDTPHRVAPPADTPPKDTNSQPNLPSPRQVIPPPPSPKDTISEATRKARSLVEMRERRSQEYSQIGARGDDSGYDVDHYEQEGVPGGESRQERKKKKKKRRKKRNNETEPKVQGEVPAEDEGIEVEYVAETLDVKDPVYAQFAKIFETFKLTEKPETAKKDEPKEKPADKTVEAAKKDDDDENELDSDSEEEETQKKEEQGGDKEEKLSKKKLKLKNRMSVAELKQTVHRPDVVEMHDVTAPDPKLLVYLKACRNTVPVPRHWCFKRKFLQGKRGIIKPPFQLPEFIQKTGIMEMREALQEKEDAKNMKAKMREKIRPKMGKIDIDYQKLHDAFFKWQTKPKMSIHGDLYYEGKEFETKLKEKKPGDLSDDLRTALGMPTGQGSNLVPPPWLIAMQRYGPPPSYPNLKIPGLNAPIPEGASFGYHAGGWGKPPVDEHGRPLYGDVFGMQQTDVNIVDDEQIDSNLWGELESESEESEESEEESEEEAPDQSGLVTPAETGLVTPSGLTSIPAGMETPDMIELRKRKNIEDAMESGSEQPTLYTVLPEKRVGVGAMMMGSSHVYDLATAAPTGTRKTPGGLSEGVEVALDPSELELDPAAMQARYDEQLREQQNTQKEDFSDMVAEHAARQQKKRKKTTDSGKAAKKYKEFKF